MDYALRILPSSRIYSPLAKVKNQGRISAAKSKRVRQGNLDACRSALSDQIDFGAAFLEPGKIYIGSDKTPLRHQYSIHGLA
ncbi:MAG TPA: hypothetical protein VFC55_00420, partial [Desulfobaccales bacterium]|nr:hypothetical protein [Desulfobaccales bacterium]